MGCHRYQGLPREANIHVSITGRGEDMLKPAKLYEDQIKQKNAEIMFDTEYMYAENRSWREEVELRNNTWHCHEFASVNEDDEVIGTLSYSIDRDSRVCFGLQIINYKKDSLSTTFGKDLSQLFYDIFFKFKFRKLKFGVIVGNPAEKFYDKYIEKIGGRVVGVYEEDDILMDGELYDYKAYEVLDRHFLKAYSTNKENFTGGKNRDEQERFRSK